MLFLVWGIMHKAAINTHVKKKKKRVLSLVMFHTHPPSPSSKLVSDLSITFKENASLMPTNSLKENENESMLINSEWA